ncbi:hypothetical protein [Nocardioides jishulii]|uniref:Uncharacterized protein n=1 Tax=Nocardioides jishulii TaxID=2575440 RepID=A0A4U2YKX4_9ACTN|nr:hypothetical protein [Nocardioides jishulii]QCX26679.1 hypothetical protein FCL41_03305 [Nocardioides jishulii]TKI60351.1 hypothetical protein FC770_16245 [Nocardioides jishulii]
MFEDVTTPGDLVALARANAAAVRRAEADTLLIAYACAVAHPALPDGSDAAVFQVAEATIHACPALPAEGVAWIDQQVAPFIEKTGRAQVDRLTWRRCAGATIG